MGWADTEENLAACVERFEQDPTGAIDQLLTLAAEAAAAGGAGPACSYLHVAVQALSAVEMPERAMEVAQQGVELAREAGIPEAVAVFEAVISGAPSVPQVVEQLYARAAEDLAAATTEADELVALAAGNGDMGAEASFAGMAAELHHALGQLDQARAHADRALEIARMAQDDEAMEAFIDLVARVAGPTSVHWPVRLRIDALVASARASGPAGAAVDAVAAADSAQGAGEALAEASMRNLAAQLLAASGDTFAALPHAERARDIAKEVGDAEAEGSFEALVQSLQPN